MEVRLTPQQSETVHAHPGRALPVVDIATSERFVLVPEPDYVLLQDLAGQHSEASHERLKSLIQEGISSPTVTASEAFARLRAVAAQVGKLGA